MWKRTEFWPRPQLSPSKICWTFERGIAPNLLESEAHLSLSREVGDGLISGVFLPPDWIAEHAMGSYEGQPRAGSPICCGKDPDALDFYMTGPNAWGSLSDFEMALFGYRHSEGIQGDRYRHLLPGYGRRRKGRSEELKKRWDGFHLNAAVDSSVRNTAHP